MVDFSKGYQPTHFGCKDGVWGKDLQEGVIYRGRTAVAKRFRKLNGVVQCQNTWGEDRPWHDCNPDPHSVFFPVEDDSSAA